MLNKKRKGFMIVLSAPSGTGKTTVCREVVKKDKNVKYSISCTTRPRRKGERHGRDYLFCTREEFEEMIRKNKLLEYEEVYGYYYGTPRKKVEELLKKGYDVIADLDIKGALNLKKKLPGTVTVFLFPPSLKELERRLKKRGDSLKQVKERLKYAREEMERAKEFDYIVMNDKLKKTVEDILAIIRAERLKKERIYEG